MPVGAGERWAIGAGSAAVLHVMLAAILILLARREAPPRPAPKVEFEMAELAAPAPPAVEAGGAEGGGVAAPAPVPAAPEPAPEPAKPAAGPARSDERVALQEDMQRI